MNSLKTSAEGGIDIGEKFNRAEHFGSNYKEPPTRTPYCKFFMGALEDFMLRLLLVCAVISISIEVGFADKGDRSHGKYYLIEFKYSTYSLD
jgi:magnesium-transporting ATPase (P-type)